MNLVARPAVEEAVLRGLGASARHNGDTLLGLLTDAQLVDADRHRRWTGALVKLALETEGNRRCSTAGSPNGRRSATPRSTPIAPICRTRRARRRRRRRQPPRCARGWGCKTARDASRGGGIRAGRRGNYGSRPCARLGQLIHHDLPHPVRRRRSLRVSADEDTLCARRCARASASPTTAGSGAAAIAGSNSSRAKWRRCGPKRPAFRSASASAAGGWPASRGRWAIASIRVRLADEYRPAIPAARLTAMLTAGAKSRRAWASSCSAPGAGAVPARTIRDLSSARRRGAARLFDVESAQRRGRMAFRHPPRARRQRQQRHVRRASRRRTLTLDAPYGALICASDNDRDIVCVAGGSGVGPIASVVLAALRDETARRIHVFEGARTAPTSPAAARPRRGRARWTIRRRLSAAPEGAAGPAPAASSTRRSRPAPSRSKTTNIILPGRRRWSRR